MAGACVCRLQRLQADAGSDSLLFSIGYRWGISIDRLFSTTSLKRIRENCTSRHGQKKKELRSVGPPRLPPTFSSLKISASFLAILQNYSANRTKMRYNMKSGHVALAFIYSFILARLLTESTLLEESSCECKNPLSCVSLSPFCWS